MPHSAENCHVSDEGSDVKGYVKGDTKVVAIFLFLGRVDVIDIASVIDIAASTIDCAPCDVEMGSHD
jgi:hypothetical protein